MRVLVVGVGSIGQRHVRLIQDLGHTVAPCDTNPSLVDAAINHIILDITLIYFNQGLTDTEWNEDDGDDNQQHDQHKHKCHTKRTLQSIRHIAPTKRRTAATAVLRYSSTSRRR